MKATRKSPVFVGMLALLLALAALELGFMVERWVAGREAQARLVQRQQEFVALRDVTPPPSYEVADAIEADLGKALAAVTAMEGALRGQGRFAEQLKSVKVPTARTDAFFDLATYVEKMRELARTHQVVVRAEAGRFGFGRHANGAPPAELIEAVFRQRMILQHVVERLLEARPHSLVSVQRERPLTRKEREEREAAIAAAAAAGTPVELPAEPDHDAAPGDDYFGIDPRASARVASHVDAQAFRLVFTGETNALRQFMNRLAAFELPILVRQVEVEPVVADDAAAASSSAESAEPPSRDDPAPAASTAGRAPGIRRPTSSAPTPIVAKPISKFTVTVEYLELTQPADPTAAPSA